MLTGEKVCRKSLKCDDFLFLLKEFRKLSIIFAVTMKNFEYKAIRALWNLGARLPFKVLYLFSDIIYLVIYYVARYRRKVVRDNLVNSFPEKSLDEIVAIEKKFYSSFCDYMVETIKLMRMSPERIKKHIRFDGVEDIMLSLFLSDQSCGLIFESSELRIGISAERVDCDL